MRPLDKTQQTYVTGENEALVKFFQELKTGLKNLVLTTTRDGKGGERVSGAKRASNLYYESAFEQGFLKFHERSIDEIRYMREIGMLVSPNPKTMRVEKISGGSMENGIARCDSIIKVFNSWYKFCDTNHKPARAATIYVFGDGMNFTQAAKLMRANGIKASDKTVKGLSILGLELYKQVAKKVDRHSE